MNIISKAMESYDQLSVSKTQYIESMYKRYHSILFQYADRLPTTEIKKIEIEDDRVTMTTRSRGIRIECPREDLRTVAIEILNFKFYEKPELTIIEQMLLDDCKVLDIGANVGWYSLNLALSKSASSIYSFEPIPQTYEYLVRNLSINLIRNVKHYNLALSNFAGTTRFYYYPQGTGNASAANLSGREEVQTIECKVLTIDEFVEIEGIRTIDFIKCDVEGSELFVFQGGINTISRFKPIIFTEILRKWTKKFNYSANEIFELLKKLGYCAFKLVDRQLIELSTMTEATLETNFFFLHRENHEHLVHKYCTSH